MNAPQSRAERIAAGLADMGRSRKAGESPWTLYERMKQYLYREGVGLTPQEYESLLRQCAAEAQV